MLPSLYYPSIYIPINPSISIHILSYVSISIHPSHWFPLSLCLRSFYHLSLSICTQVNKTDKCFSKYTAHFDSWNRVDCDMPSHGSSLNNEWHKAWSCDQGWSNRTWLQRSCSCNFHLYHWGKLYSIASAIFSYTQEAEKKQKKNNNMNANMLFPFSISISLQSTNITEWPFHTTAVKEIPLK